MTNDPWFSTQLQRYGPDSGAAACLALPQAQAYCRRLARRHYENFVVASLALPRSVRSHFYNIYAFCRWADDLADEVDDPQQSLRLLDWWEGQLEQCYEGESRHPVFVALAETIRQYALPIELPRRLLTAFRQDQRVTRYPTFEDLLGYCHNSANPVGEMILLIGRCHEPQCVSLSNKICTGLQLANFWQDVARDFAQGRVYVPQEDLAEFGCREWDIAQRTAGPAFCRLLAMEVERTQQYFRDGETLTQYVPPWLRADVELFVRGGRATLQAIRQAGYDVLRRRPRISRWTQLGLLAAAGTRRWRGVWPGCRT